MAVKELEYIAVNKSGGIGKLRVSDAKEAVNMLATFARSFAVNSDEFHFMVLSSPGS
jgi:hypothetical protein